MKKQSERWLATAKRRRWNRDDAVRALEAVAASGETIDAFARRHGLIPERLYRWRRRFERTANVAARATAPAEAPMLAPVVVRGGSGAGPVVVRGGGAAGPVVSVTLGGLKIEVTEPEALSPAWVAGLVAELGGGRA